MPRSTIDPNPAHDTASPPGAWQLLLEARAPWEFAALLLATPWLARAPAGDGHPVLVLPGLGASDVTTIALRNFLHARGFTPYSWQLGFNLGPRDGVLEACRARVREVFDRHREPLSIVGWSLGGIYARELAKERPELVRSVVTLGTPFTGHPRSTNAWRFYEFVSGQKVGDPEVHAQLRVPPACPTASIFSRSDGVVAWSCSLNGAGDHLENIEVPASHVGMGLNPLALWVVADRLAQRPGSWAPFEPPAGLARFIKPTPAAA